jgi:hypothetical protein
MEPKKKYWSGNGHTYVLDDEGHAIREASEGEAKEAEKEAWSKLWDDFGVGLDDEED